MGVWLWLGASATAATPADDMAQVEGVISSRILRRVIKTFDFDEQRLGNFESTPMNWTPFRGAGFPPYLRARFDRGEGHESAPSVRLSLAGGSVGLVYRAGAIPVHPQSDYLVTAWARTDRLVHARAQLSACYLDRALRPMEATERFSPAAGGEASGNEWQRVTVALPRAGADARWIGLGIWVRQPAVRGDLPSGARPIIRQDLGGGAWFDDIAVLRLPRAEIAAVMDPTAGDALHTEALSVAVTDVYVADLTARVRIFDAAGETVMETAVDASIQAGTVHRVPVAELPVGWYRAGLTVDSPEGRLATQEAVFLRPSHDLPAVADRCNFIGLTINGAMPASRVEAIEPLIRWLGAGAVKVELWRADTSDEVLLHGNAARDALLSRLRGEGALIVGVLADPPASLAVRFPPEQRDLLPLLAAAPRQWRPYLAFPLTRHCGYVDVWQLGRDADAEGMIDGPWTPAIGNVRGEVDRLATHASFCAAWSARAEPDRERMPTDVLSIHLPSSVASPHVATYLGSFAGAGFPRTWVHVAAPQRGEYARRVRLGELVKRLVIARQSGAEFVFVDPPWDEEVRDGDTIARPEEELLVLRALGVLCGGAEPAGAMALGEGVSAWLFRREDESGVLVAWADVEPGSSVSAPCEFGAEARQYDMWGRASASAGGRNDGELHVGCEPVIVAPVDAEMFLLRSGVRAAGPVLQAGLPESAGAIVVRNPTGARIRGLLTVESPTGWSIRPPSGEFVIDPGGELEHRFSVRLPRNAPCGRYEVPVNLHLEGRTEGVVRVAVPMEVGLAGVDVRVLSQVVGGELRVQQRVTNRGEAPVTLRSVLVSPEHPRMGRVISELAAGETAVAEYVLDRAEALAGQSVRVSLVRTDSTATHNHVIRVEGGSVAGRGAGDEGLQTARGGS